MKKLLVILLIINILTIAFSFFMLLSTSVLYAIIALILGGLEIVPIIAILSCLDSIEELEYQQNKLFGKLKLLEDNINGTPDIKTSNFKDNSYKETANAAWECIKCGTVNKPHTDCCSHCNAQYSSYINPTDNPYANKKVSRWVKFK